MKPLTFLLLLIVAAAAAAGGYFAARQGGSGEEDGGRRIAYYQSAMHPWIKSDKPGNCTICGMKLTPVYEGEAGFAVDEGIVALDTNAINVIHVQTAPVQRREVERRLEVAGRIEADKTRFRVISAYVDGRIEELFVNYVGARVQEGEPLATIYSPELLTAEREYLTVLNQTNLTASPRTAGEHERMLLAARQRLKQLGLRDEQIDQLADKPGTNFTTRITAPISGTVVTRSVYEGQYVKEGEKLFEIADFSKMWFVFDVYEQDLPWVHLGQMVKVTSPALPGKVFEGPITFIDPNLNEATRSARVRVELENPLIEENGRTRRLLLNNLYADGRIQIETGPVLAVPRTAVLHPGDFPRVYIEKGLGAYEPRRVKLGRHGEEFWEVLEGVEEGEQVVTAGNLLIESQARIQGGGARQIPAPAPVHDHGRHEEGIDIDAADQSAARELFDMASQVNAGLAADDPAAYNTHREHLSHLARMAAQELKDGPAGEAAAKLEERARLEEAANLGEARENYMPFSNAVAGLARALRETQAPPGVKVFKCPMYPLPGKTAYWVQSSGPIRNPFYGSEMLDCGVEVK